MGYWIDLVDSEFFIANKDKDMAYQAVKQELSDKDWIQECICLEEIFDAYDYDVENDPDNNICSIGFVGEKLGDEETFFGIIAPYVKSDSYIEIYGEDYDNWRWLFKDGALKVIKPKVSWEE